MPRRKNIKVSPDVHRRLSEHKPDNITWDGYLGHLLDAYTDPRPRLPPFKGGSLEEVANRDDQKLAERANELVKRVDFVEVLEAPESESDVFAAFVAELTAERVVEKLESDTEH